MKKTLIAMAALAAASGVMAQTPTSQPIAASGLTLFGVLDARVNKLDSTNAGSLTRLDNSGQMSSRLGFRGMEDLGGGWAAAFWLEAGMSNDDGRGGNSTSNNTNMGQNLTLGSGSTQVGTPATATGAQLRTPTTSGLGGLQGLTFNRAATISVIGKGAGEIRLGRDYTPSFWNLTVYDPFGTNGVGSALNVALGTQNPAGASIAPPGTAKPQIRTSNSLGWLSPNWSGFRAQVQYAFSEIPTSCVGVDTVGTGQSGSNSCVAADGDGKYLGFRVTYDQGPLSLAAARGTASYSKVRNAEANTNAATLALNSTGNAIFLGDYVATNFGVAYDLKVAKLWGQYGTQEQKGSTTPAATDAKLTHYLLGVSVPMNAWTHKFSYNWGTREQTGVNDRTQKQIAVGTVYNLSKRTSVYGTYSRMTTSGLGTTASMGLTSTAVTATSGASATGIDLGVTHRF